MKYYTLVLSLFMIAAAGCAKEIPPPNEEQMKQDYIAEKGDVTEFVLKQRFTNEKAGTDEAHVFTTLDDGTATIKGNYVLGYKKFDQGWKHESTEREGDLIITMECRPGVKCDWDLAMDYCKREGSRLPTMAELDKMYDSECSERADRPGNCSGSYWSSDVNSWNGEAQVKFFSNSGFKTSFDKILPRYVRCVREGQ